MDAPVELANGTGVTRDLSTTGVYFVCDQPVQVGARLSLTILLDDNLADMPVRMDCAGTVVRIDRVGPRIGVAMKFDPPERSPTLH
jgi:hypothetical protein